MTSKPRSSIASRMEPCYQKNPGGPTSTIVTRRARALVIKFWMRWQCGPARLPDSLTCRSAGVATRNIW
eukprot:7379845-Pyramimonas_sp.AAC.1